MLWPWALLVMARRLRQRARPHLRELRAGTAAVGSGRHLSLRPRPQVFDQALEGGGAKNINFQELAADLAQITFDYPFRIPPYFALIIRAIGVLEGIALTGNPGPRMLPPSPRARFSHHTAERRPCGENIESRFMSFCSLRLNTDLGLGIWRSKRYLGGLSFFRECSSVNF